MINQTKKLINEADFIPKPARILTIIHLCFVFAYISWHFLGPYFSSHFERKSQTAMALSLIGDPSLSDYVGGLSNEKKSLLNQHSKRFQKLPQKDKDFLTSQYLHLANLQNGPESIRLSQIFQDFLNTPIYLLGWIFFSLLICFLLLLRIEGALAASYLIPILALAYSLNNFYTAPPQSLPADAELFPSESTIITNYIHEPLPNDIASQQRTLKLGWEAYLLDKWHKKEIRNDPLNFNHERALENASYAFTLARFHLISKNQNINTRKDTQLPPLLLTCFFIWNLYFAVSINRIKARSKVW